MTKFDIKNYFQLLYNVNISLVNTRVEQGNKIMYTCNTCYYGDNRQET